MSALMMAIDRGPTFYQRVKALSVNAWTYRWTEIRKDIFYV
jgi:hypothetical protein